MYLIVILIALSLLQFWGAKNPLHRDTMFYAWSDLVAGWAAVRSLWWVRLAIVLMVPVVLVAVLAWALPLGFWLVLAVVVLLYSLGRGEFAPETNTNTIACK